MYIKTLMGIDQAGNRLADEVMQLVQRRQSLKRISFLAHSLGGLIARYAIAALYSPNAVVCDRSNYSVASTDVNSEGSSYRRRGVIGGLEPVNFITLATPHLGVRGKKQLPLLLGIPFLENLAPPIATVFVGPTGSQLFLTDGRPNKLPLLLRMASDHESGKFISALGAFTCRVLYANVSYDLMVGWHTSSIRRKTELVKPPGRSLDGYKYIMEVQHSEGLHFHLEATNRKQRAQDMLVAVNTVKLHEIMEDEMARGLQQLAWKRIDVSFHSACWPFFAHNHMNVRREWLNYAGAEVVAHVVDGIKQQENSASLIAVEPRCT